MRSTHSPSIRSRYDYYYSTLSPGSSVANFYDNQNLSLFGDPVPPATDFLETLDNHLYGSFRRRNSSGGAVAATVQSGDSSSSNYGGMADISRPPIPYQREFIRIMSSTSSAGSSSNNRPVSEVHPSSTKSPSTIDIDDRTVSPLINGLLREDARLGFRKRSSSSFSEEYRVNADTFGNNNERHLSQSIPPKGIFSSEPSSSRRSSNPFSEPLPNRTHFPAQELTFDYNTNTWNAHPLSPQHQYPINDCISTSSSDQKTDCCPLSTASRLPRPKLNRNTMNIGHGGGNAMIAIIPDSTMSSSEDQMPLQISAERPRSTVPNAFQPYQVLPCNQINSANSRCTAKSMVRTHASSLSADSGSELSVGVGSASASGDNILTDAGGAGDGNSSADSGVTLPMKRELAQTIHKETVTTGAGYRLHQPRQHKKASFAIINEFTPNHSRAPSPTALSSAAAVTTGRVSPFRGRGFKPSTASRVSSRAVSPQFLDVEAPIVDDLMRPTCVQFNTNTYVDKQIDIGAGAAVSAGSGPRGILQKRLADTLFADTDASYRNDEMHNYAINTDPKHKTLIQIPSRHDQTMPSKPFSVLPEKTKATVAPSPAPRRKFYNSTGDLRTQSSSKQKPPINPRSYHKGLLRVVSSANTSPSRIPRRQSITASADNLLLAGRRRSSISSNRRLSNATQLSIIDLGITASNQSSRSGSRISKPTVLSPIIGTPNKDSAEQSAQEDEPPNSGQTVHVNGVSPLQSPSRIPMRSGSSNNTMTRTHSGITLKTPIPPNTNSRSNSRAGSREPSPGASRRSGGQPVVQATKPFMRKGSNRTSSNRTGAPLASSKSMVTRPLDALQPTRSSVRKTSVTRKDVDNNKGVTKKEFVTPYMKKTASSTLKRESSNFKREPSNLKREPSNLKREPSNLKREPSNLKREPSNLKREPSNLKREPSSLKREPSNLKREPSNLRREPSTLRRDTPNLKREGSTLRRGDNGAAGTVQQHTANATLKRQTSKLMMGSVLSKNNSDSMLAKRLEKKNSFKNEKRKTTSESDGGAADETNATTAATTTTTTTGTNTTATNSGSNSKEKLVPMTASNVVSMTTAAIAAQPVQITTAVTNSTGGSSLSKTNSSNQLIGATTIAATADAKGNHSATMLSPASTILEKSQKTLENIQKTVTEATDEIHRTIDENLTDLKSLEHDMKMEEAKAGGAAPPSATTAAAAAATGQTKAALLKKSSTQTLLDKVTESLETTKSTVSTNATPIEASVSVIEQDVDHSNRLSDGGERVSERSISAMPDNDLQSGNATTEKQSGNEDNSQKDANNRVNGDGSDNGDDESGGSRGSSSAGCCKCSKCCTPCLSCLCLPCSRLKKTSCCQRCRRKKTKTDGKPDQITKPTVIKTEEPTKESCWQRMKCCSCCSRRANKDTVNETSDAAKQTTATTVTTMQGDASSPTKERGRCALCLSKFLCCRRTNKIQSTSSAAAASVTDDAGSVRKCCFCIPCGRRKKPDAAAWSENRRESILSEPQKQGCCGGLCAKIMCCRKKEPQESRRTSMNSKKQSIAPTIPIEDTRPKLDMSLVEHASMMKGAIPILPMCLAWFCLLCNCFVPGLGTIFSGLFCLCLGVPRFSQHDGARARLGSFVINCIVGVAQAFTLLFCLVGWGWAVWWGTIMLRVARKRRKLRQAERDAEMQQEEQTTSSNRTAMPPIMSQNHRDVETGNGAGVSSVGT